MTDFVKELASSRFEGTQMPFYPEKVKGYSEAEVDMIASQYNLEIHGQFRQFLTQMGKCSGGLLWGDNFPMYDSRYHAERFKSIQKNLMEDQFYLSFDAAIDAVENKLFFLLHESERTHTFYVATAHPDNYILAYYKDLNNTVEWSELDLLATLKSYVFYETKAWRFSDVECPEARVDKWTTGRLL